MRLRLSVGLTILLFFLNFGHAAVQENKPAPLQLDSPPFNQSLFAGGSASPNTMISQSSGAAHNQAESSRDAVKTKKDDRLKQRRQRSYEAAIQWRQQWEENARYWRDLVENNPATPFYYRRLLYTLKRLGQCDEILDVGHRLLRIYPLDSYTLSMIGGCYYVDGRYDKAIEYLQLSAWYNPSDFQTHRTLGSCFYNLGRYSDATTPFRRAVVLQPNDFSTNYWLGVCLMKSRQLSAAAEPLAQAARLNRSSYWANQNSGWVFVQLGRYREAIPNLEAALAVHKDAQQTKILLFTAYLVTGEFVKAAALSPLFVAVMAAALTSGYLFGLIPLLIFSLKRSAAAFPNVFFSLGWLVLFMEGQIGFIFLLALMPWFKSIANPLGAVLLSGLPLLVAAIAFGRHRWGEPFRWPPRFGGSKIVLTSVLLLAGTYICNFALQQTIRSEGPLQNTVPIFKEALHSSPSIAFLMLVVAIPMIEEVLFRGLLFGSLRRFMSSVWAVIVSALIFAAFHLQPMAFVQLFLLGCLLGWARARTGSVALPILLHVLNNSLAAVGLLSGKV